MDPTKDGSSVLAGPFHPAFRQLVEGSMWYDSIAEKLKFYIDFTRSNLLSISGIEEINNVFNLLSIYYNVTRELIKIERIEATKTLFEEYNKNNDYEALSKVINNLITLSNNVNKDIESQDYSNFAAYQKKLRSIYSSFARWMAEGEL